MTTLNIRSQGDKTITTGKTNPFVFYLLWIIVTTIAWGAGVLDLNADAKTYMDIIRLLPIYLADGLLIGLVLGIGQALVLRRLTNLSGRWIWVTLLGYGLTFLTGLIVTVLIPFIIIRLRYGIYFLPLREPSSFSIFLNMDDLFWGGLLIGVIQWPVLKSIIPNPSREKALLWVLANWFVFGSSLFVRAFTHGTTLASFQMAIMGIVMGIVTGGILLTFLSNADLAEGN